MTEQKRDQHLATLIAKFYNISKNDYNGKTYDNVCNIFYEGLDLEEQKTMLRGMLGIYAATAHGFIHSKELIDFGDMRKLIDHVTEFHDEIARLASQGALKLPIPAETAAASMTPTVTPEGTSYSQVAGMGMTIGVITAVLLFLLTLVSGDDPDMIQKFKPIKDLVGFASSIVG